MTTALAARRRVADLVGRDDELSAAVALLHGDAALIRIVGDRGMGRSHFARAVADVVRALGWSVSVIVATETSKLLPYGAVASLLPRDAAPEAQPRAVARAARLGSGTRRLIVVDDAHQLDRASATVIAALAREPGTRVLLTHPTNAVPPHALRRGPPRHGIELGGLTLEAVRLIAGDVLGGPVDAAVADRFARASHGSPSLVKAVASAAYRAGAVVDSAGRWRWRDDVDELADELRAELGDRALEVGPLVAALRLVNRVPQRATPIGGHEGTDAAKAASQARWLLGEGRVEAAQQLALAHLDQAAVDGDHAPGTLTQLAWVIADAAPWTATVDDCERRLAKAIEHAGPDEIWWPAVTAALGHLAAARGRLARAGELLLDALDPLESRDPGGHRCRCLADLAMVEALTGHSAAATRTASAATTGCEASPLDARLASAWALVGAGDPASARRELESARDEAVQRGSRFDELVAVHTAARVTSSAALYSDLAAVATRVEGPLAAAVAEGADAAAHGDGSRLSEVAERFIELGAPLHAAETAIAASAGFARVGLLARAAESLEVARSLHARCDGAVTPALRRAERRVALTPREEEVVELAAAGFSNRDIAQRLRASVRTVEWHLEQAFNKLGVRSRQQLASRAGPGPDVRG